MGVPSSFVGNWVKERFSDILVKTLERVTHQSDVSLNIVVLENLIEKYGNDNIIEGSSLLLSRKTSGLNPKYTFDTFVVGSSNQFAHAASRAVAESPAKAYNPLFLYSGVGLGKTHLLNAVGHFICNNSKSHMNVTYVSSEHFTNEVINSIRYDKMVDFRNKYRSVDVLLIDDIQFIAGKERTQEEFFHTFNTLYDTNKQIIISSDKYPKEIQNIDDRLRSRYEWGLLADIGPPDFETRVAILRKKADIENIPLPDDVAQYLATHIKTNVRELEGSLIKLGALSSLTKQEINLGMVQETLWYTIQDQKRNVTGEEIQKAVAEHFQLKISDLRSKNRTKTLVVPRHIAMYLCREISKTSFPEIGRLFGGKDHSTVIHACRMIEKLRDTDLATRSLLDSLTKRLKN
jgi:chromosomal replication initiator protein